MATVIARCVQIPDSEWRAVGELAEKVDRSKSWVVSKLIKVAAETVFEEESRPFNEHEDRMDEDEALEYIGLR